MGRLVRALTYFVAAAVLVFIGLLAFLHLYLTGDRIKAIIIPMAEQALDREVAIGKMEIDILKGIDIKDFSVKERDGKTDFLNIKAFMLQYDPWYLLRRQFLVTEVHIKDPILHLSRDHAGSFNFGPLVLLLVRTNKTAFTLPVALKADLIDINNARIVFRDAFNELPSAVGKAGLKLSADAGRDLSNFRYHGRLNFVADVRYKNEVKSHVSGTCNFDQDRLGFKANINREKEQIHLDGHVRDYVGVPDIQLDVVSNTLDLDHIIAMVAGLSRSASGSRTSIFLGLRARGEVKAGRAIYRCFKVDDFYMKYFLKKGILMAKHLSGKTLGGEVNSAIEVDLTRPELAFKGQLVLTSAQVADFYSAMAQEASNAISGTLRSSVTFAGTGTEWPEIRETLTADGNYTLRDGWIRNTALTSVAANLLGIRELNNLSFKDISGTLQIANGKTLLRTRMNSKGLKAMADGSVGLDGKLDLPLTLRLSPKFSKRLKRRVLAARYLTDRENNTVIFLKLIGTLSRPALTFDTTGVKDLGPDKK